MLTPFSVYLWREGALFVLPFLLSDKNTNLLKDAYVRGDARIFIGQCRSFRNPAVDPWVANIFATALLAGLDGISDEKDREAISLLREVTSVGGCPPAWYSFGMCHSRGIGVPLDAVAATQCFLEGARRGCSLCCSKFHDIPFPHVERIISQL